MVKLVAIFRASTIQVHFEDLGICKFTGTVKKKVLIHTYMYMTLISICKAARFTCKKLWTTRF